MNERPILFSAPMVRALLDGSKTQTRRAMKIQPTHFNPVGVPRLAQSVGNSEVIACPYGQPGDQLWVREAFAFTDAHMPRYEGSIEYKADNKCLAVSCNDLIDVPHRCDPRPFEGPWKPSIHMPRWASRLTLEIVSVRIERLNDISRGDAMAEGCPFPNMAKGDDPRKWYAELWNAINGPGSWDKNPWVWVVEFTRHNAELCGGTSATNAVLNGET